MPSTSLLELRDFSVALESGGAAPVPLVSDVSLRIDAGETLCVVGESGSGKTVTALSIMRLLEYSAPVTTSGSVLFEGRDISGVPAESVAELRGRRIGMVFQECMEALNPTRRIGRQLIEVLDYHRDGRPVSRAAALRRAEELLRAVEIRDPAGCLRKYPHQLSGGMQQRVMIAMALMRDPALLIADEPTTALDVTVQAEILRLLRDIQRRLGMACLLITHDMGIAAEVADRIGVMYAGRLVEVGRTRDILRRPLHPYTRGLLSCVPRAGVRTPVSLTTIPGSVPLPTDDLPGCRFAPRCALATDICREEAPPLRPHELGTTVACWNVTDAAPQPRTPAAPAPPEPARDERDTEDEDGPAFVDIRALTKRYAGGARFGGGGRRGGVLAVDEVSLRIREGEFFGVVGETGSGKSTLGRLVARLEDPTSGDVVVDGRPSGRRGGDVREFRRTVQVVFQNSHGSLDPRLTVGDSIAEPLGALLGVSGKAARARVAELLASVGLPEHVLTRRPGELSGGQLQRVAIARAIAVDPRLLVADEPTSALDVSVQAQVMNLLIELRRRRRLTYLFITHNLSLVLAVADRVGVMYLGALVEIAPAEVLAAGPAHPYSAMLLHSNPDPDGDGFPETAPETIADAGSSAELWDGAGCRFRSRCPQRQERCDVEAPVSRRLAPGHHVSCHFPLSAPAPVAVSTTPRAQSSGR